MTLCIYLELFIAIGPQIRPAVFKVWAMMVSLVVLESPLRNQR